MTWDDEVTAFNRGEFLQLVLTSDAPNTQYVLQQWFIARDNIRRARHGAARAFATEVSARAFVARHHSTLISLALPGDNQPNVVAVWRGV